jgi:hypothetical protein
VKRRPLFILSQDSLLSLPTRQLLGRLQALQRCEESRLLSDCGADEVLLEEQIFFKDTSAWKAAYAEVKAVLATREHVG